MKKCRRCQQDLPVEEFDTTPTGRLKHSCKKCLLSKKCSTCGQEFDSKITGYLCSECRKDVDRGVMTRRAARTETEIISDMKRLRPDGRKRCYSCDRYLVLDEFGRNKYSADGCGHLCKKCLRDKYTK